MPVASPNDQKIRVLQPALRRGGGNLGRRVEPVDPQDVDWPRVTAASLPVATDPRRGVRGCQIGPALANEIAGGATIRQDHDLPIE